METAIFFNKDVEITSVYFRNSRSRERFEAFPKRMLLDGREYTFLEGGLRYLVQKGQDLIKLFDVSDGQTDFRLRLDRDNRWTLIGIK